MTEKKEPSAFHVDYTFRWLDGSQSRIEMALDPVTLRFLEPPKTRGSAWTRLKSNQCTHCPLREIDHPLCPVAWRIEEVLPLFTERFSYEPVEVVVETAARTYSRKTTVEVGFSSLLGIAMASSGCPTMARLRPLVRYHLPFATADESIYRVIAWYLMEQYLKARQLEKNHTDDDTKPKRTSKAARIDPSQQADWALKRLVEDYADIREVNQKMAARLQTSEQKDAGKNAVVRLDNFAHLLTFSVGLDMVEDLLRKLEQTVEME